MKKHYLKCSKSVCLILTLFLSLISIETNAQETFTITNTFSDDFVKTHNLRFLPVAKVHQKDVDVYKLESKEVPTADYERLSKEIELVKSGYETYVSRQEAIKTISAELRTFIYSSDKYDLKESHLINAQNLATKHDINVEIKDDRLSTNLFKEVTKDNTNKKRNLLIYKKGKRSSTEDVIKCKEFIENIPYNEPIELYREYNTYRQLTEQLSRVQKTEVKDFKTNISERRSIMIVDSTITDRNDLKGNFIELPTKYYLIYDNYKDIFVKYQLTENLNGYQYNDGEDRLFSIIQNVDTKEMFYIMNHKYLSELRRQQDIKALIETVNKLGYKEFRSDDKYDENLYIKSKTSIIKLDNWTREELKRNPNFIATLDNDQMQIASLVNQTRPHYTILDKYSSLYNVQRSRMSATDINAWRTATTKALPLFNKIVKLTEKYDANFSFKLIDQSKTWDDFVDEIIIARGILKL